MWLASVSLRDQRGRIIGTADWTRKMWKHAEDCLRFDALGGIGDQSRERFFRMCITACLHRGVRNDELALIPTWWHEAEAIDIAGGPVEVLSSQGVPEIASAMPCKDPGHRPLVPGRLDLWFPIDCGECEPCLARLNVRICAA